MGAKLTEAQLAFDLAKLELIVQRYRVEWDDPLIDMQDIAGIRRCASIFGVTESMAYRRVHSLGLLAYQQEPTALAKTEEADGR